MKCIRLHNLLWCKYFLTAENQLGLCYTLGLKRHFAVRRLCLRRAKTLLSFLFVFSFLSAECFLPFCDLQPRTGNVPPLNPLNPVYFSHETGLGIAVNPHVLRVCLCLSLLSVKGPQVNFVTTDRSLRFVAFLFKNL